MFAIKLTEYEYYIPITGMRISYGWWSDSDTWRVLIEAKGSFGPVVNEGFDTEIKAKKFFNLIMTNMKLDVILDPYKIRYEMEDE